MNRTAHRAPRALACVLALVAGLMLYLLSIPPLTLWVMLDDGQDVHARRPWLDNVGIPYLFFAKHEPTRTPLRHYYHWCIKTMEFERRARKPAPPPKKTFNF